MLNLGNLEESVLLLVIILKENAYGVAIALEYQQQYGKSISAPAIHTVLRRLEKKELIKSKVGGATNERGGRSKRIYEVTQAGYHAVKAIQTHRDQLWSKVPKLSFN